MINWIKSSFYSLPDWLRDALEGLLYACLIALVILLSDTDDAGFRYLEL